MVQAVDRAAVRLRTLQLPGSVHQPGQCRLRSIFEGQCAAWRDQGFRVGQRAGGTAGTGPDW